MICFHMILSYIGMILTFINIYNLKGNRRLITIYFSIIYIFLVLSYRHLGISPLYIVNIIMSVTIYKHTKKILLTIVVPLSTTLLCAIINIISYYLYLEAFKVSIYQERDLLNIFMYYIFTYILMILLARSFNKSVMKNIEKFNVKVKTMIVLISILVFIIYFETLRQIRLLDIQTICKYPGNALLILYFITFVSFLFLISMINSENRLNEMNEYNKKLEIMTNEMKKFRHDYKNILLSMNGYIQADDMEGLKKFFYTNIEPLNEELDSYNLNIASTINIEILELKGIILSKINKAEKLGIDVNISINEVIKDISMNTIDLCRVIGIILDNCIEASLECKNPKIDICIDTNSDCTSFLISNTYIKKIDSLAELFKRGISTKGINRGIGLSNLNEILDNYEDACFSVKLDDNFIQKLDIYNS